MYEIDLSTLVVLGINLCESKIYTIDKELSVKDNSYNIINNSCKFFGSSLVERQNITKRLTNIVSKSPIIIEESRNIIFFPLFSTREKNNIWVSFNNLDKYYKDDKKTVLVFKNGQKIVLDISYYIVDNQVTRSLILDYELRLRKEKFSNVNN